jgi:gliding motility-associated-like protein
MKKLFSTLSLILLIQICFAQGGKWIWMKGAKSCDDAGNYGTMGVEAPANEPPSRYQCAYWTDLNGDFWVFGGSGVDNIGGYVTFNDMWRFKPSTNNWTWMNGPQYGTNSTGTSGAIGVPSVNWCPSARGYGAACWTDNNGFLWLMGGSGAGDDLWKYNIATNEWTLMKGAPGGFTPPTYGTLGVASPTNTPGYFSEMKSNWTDKDNNLWMIGNWNETMWKYLTATNEWVWMKGSQANTSASYGTLGVEAASNQPTGRWSYTKWKDLNGLFYIFAGYDNNGGKNDVWRFNPVTNNWTWVNGPQAVDDPGSTPAFCTKSGAITPRSRMENQTVSTVGCTNAFWNFGGYYQNWASNSLNDLWVYDADKNEWVFVGGTTTMNHAGDYGTKGVWASTNVISGRGGIAMWTDKKNNLWIFGGLKVDPDITGGSTKNGNDLWKFEPDTACIQTALSVDFQLNPMPDSVKCGSQTVTYNIPGANNIILLPNTGYTFNGDSTQIIFNNSSTTTYTIIAESNGPCPGKDTLVFNVVVEPVPISTVTSSNDVATIDNPTFSMSGGATNTVKWEWYYNNVLVSTQSTYNPTFNSLGIHCVTLVSYNNEGCTDTMVKCVEVVPDMSVTIPNVFSPNGDGKNDMFTAISKNIPKCEFSIFNRFGNVVFNTTDPKVGWNGKTNGTDCEVGTYYYQFIYTDSRKKRKVVKGDVNLVR